MKGDLKQRGDAYIKKDKAAQKRHSISRTHQMVFHGKQKVPLFARLALWILKTQKARIVDALVDNKEGN